jgi:hypothetical protein
VKMHNKTPAQRARIDHSRRGQVVPVLAVVVIILLPLVYSIVSAVIAGDEDASQPFLERPDPKHTECVRDTEYMRFHHWELLSRIRDEVVRHGIRGELGFNSCRECHISRETFCNRCHDAASVIPDCFGCHYYP